MDINSFGIVGMAPITIVCYLVGEIVKKSPLNNKWIPIICAGSGMILGVTGACFGLPGFAAGDYISAAAIGIVSGWASTGVNQSIKQLTNKE